VEVALLLVLLVLRVLLVLLVLVLLVLHMVLVRVRVPVLVRLLLMLHGEVVGLRVGGHHLEVQASGNVGGGSGGRRRDARPFQRRRLVPSVHPIDVEGGILDHIA